MAAIFREFRPHKFSELIGQDVIARVLTAQVVSAKPAQAYLFSGPRGTGKTSTARILAMALNCLEMAGGEPCLTCAHCTAALSESFFDLIEIDGASNTGVDDAREIIEKLSLLPMSGKYKIYIIDEVHMLSNNAFNALLKTIEEPPDYAIFILATTELRKVPATVLSRCQRFEFRPVEPTPIAEKMGEICSQIKVEFEPDALLIIAKNCDGGVRDALTVLDKCVSFGEKLTVALVSSVLNLASAEKISELFSALKIYDDVAAIVCLDEILELTPPTSICSQLAELYATDIVSVKGNETCVRALGILCEAENKLKFALKPELLLKSAIFSILLPDGNTNLELIARIERLESKSQNAPQSVFAPGREIPATRQELPPEPQRVSMSDFETPAENDIWKLIMAELEVPLRVLLRPIVSSKIEGGKLILVSTKQLLLPNREEKLNKIIEIVSKFDESIKAIEIQEPQSNDTFFNDI